MVYVHRHELFTFLIIPTFISKHLRCEFVQVKTFTQIFGSDIRCIPNPFPSVPPRLRLRIFFPGRYYAENDRVPKNILVQLSERF